MFRVIITGSRHWFCQEIAGRVVTRLVDRYGLEELVIVHGAAPGVDWVFAEACLKQGVQTEAHAAKWHENGRKAGPLRNQEMVDAGARFCIAVHQNLKGSRGTKDCVTRCQAAGIPVWLVDSIELIPRRIDHTNVKLSASRDHDSEI